MRRLETEGGFMKTCWRERRGTEREGGSEREREKEIKKGGGRVQKRHNIKLKFQHYDIIFITYNILCLFETFHLSAVVSVPSIQRASAPPPPKPHPLATPP